MNIYFKDDIATLRAEDQEQLSLLFENAMRKLNDIIDQKFGKGASNNYKVYVCSSDPVPAVLEEKTATPTTTQQIITPSTGKDGLSKVTISGVTAAIDANIVADNIKKDVVILGVTGTYDPTSV